MPSFPPAAAQAAAGLCRRVPAPPPGRCRHVPFPLRFALFFLLPLLLLAGLADPQYAPAASSRAPTTAQRAPAVSSRAPADSQRAPAASSRSSESALQRAIGDFEALAKHPTRGDRRDLWLEMETRFTSLARKNSGNAAASAACYAARSRQELAARSLLARDQREAARQFAAAAARFPSSPTAPECLSRQASILDTLGDSAGAAKVLTSLLAAYPKSEEAPEAKTLLERIRKRAGPEAGAPDDDPAPAPPVRSRGSGGRSGKSVLDQLGLTVQTIMLDAGHGGQDPGARAAGIVEKQFTLAMATRVGALLRKRGFTVLYTRTSNKYITLQDRPDRANSKNADLFISIHVNANTNPAVRGLEAYYLAEAKTRDAALVAARENSLSVSKISDLQFILTDLMLSSKVKESHHLANCVHQGILKRLKASNLSAHDNGVRSAPFYVLVGARMPAILVEFGYITNKTDAGNLQSEAYLQRQAEGVVDGVLQYKAELAKSVSR